MSMIGAFEAKTHLSSLLERVAKGETFTITRHGKAIAQLVPMSRPDREHTRAMIERLRKLASSQTLGGDWRQFRDAGRKW